MSDEQGEMFEYADEVTVADQPETDANGNIAVATKTEQSISVVLPDKTAKFDIIALTTKLQSHKEQRGVTMLIKWLDKYVMHVDLAEGHWERAQFAVNAVNGVRSATQFKGDKKRSLRNTAVDFYEALSTAALRQHCQLFGLNYDNYNTPEEVVEVLVKKHVDMIEAS